MPVLPLRGRVPVNGRGPAAALATDGRVYAGLDEVGVPDDARALLEALEAVLGPGVFVGVQVPGLTVETLLAGLDDRAAEVVGRRVAAQRRRRVRRS